jgi:hypothetical protein
MKKLTAIIIGIVFLLLPVSAFAAGSCTESVNQYTGGFVAISLACTGDSSDGSIPNTAVSDAALARIQGTHYLFMVSAYPTSGGTAPDAADITILDGTYDVLGGKGVNLIHATARQDTYPYSTFISNWRYWPITGGLTLAVANQSTASANFTIEMVFTR